MRWAVNLGDAASFAQQAPLVWEILLADLCRRGATVEVARRQVDGVALQMDCDDERARAVIDVVCLVEKARRIPRVRFYQGEDGRKSWKPVRRNPCEVR